MKIQNPLGTLKRADRKISKATAVFNRVIDNLNRSFDSLEVQRQKNRKTIDELARENDEILERQSAALSVRNKIQTLIEA